MDQSANLTQSVDTLFSNLEGFTQNEGLIGKPVTHGDKTFIPVVSVTLGYGTGNTASKAQSGSTSTTSTASSTGSFSPVSGTGNMSGGALGLGARLSTDAVIVIDKDKVSMMQLNSVTAAANLMDKIPQILSGMSGKQQGSQTQGQQSQQNQQSQ